MVCSEDVAKRVSVVQQVNERVANQFLDGMYETQVTGGWDSGC